MAITLDAAQQAEQRRQWLQYRNVMFVRYTRRGDWHYSASTLFDISVPGLHLFGCPDIRTALCGQSLLLVAYGERHHIPLAQMTPTSLQHLQLRIQSAQTKAAEALAARVHERFGIGEMREADHGQSLH